MNKTETCEQCTNYMKYNEQEGVCVYFDCDVQHDDYCTEYQEQGWENN